MAQCDMSNRLDVNRLYWSYWIPPAPVSPCLWGGVWGGGAVGVSAVGPLLLWGKTGLQSELKGVEETTVSGLRARYGAQSNGGGG